MKKILFALLLLPGMLRAQKTISPTYCGVEIGYYVEKLVDEAMKIAQQQQIPTSELSPQFVLSFELDTLGAVTQPRFLDNTLTGDDYRNCPAATESTRQIVLQAVERLGSWNPAVVDGRVVRMGMVMQLSLPVELFEQEQQIEPLLFRGMEPEQPFRDYVMSQMRYKGDKSGNRQVQVRFYVEADGKITIAQVVDARNPKLAHALVRAIKSSRGEWTPRKVRGVPQRAAYVYGISFSGQ